MLVIGVAEPENGIPDAQTQSLHQLERHEEDLGTALLQAGRLLVQNALWGVNGTRQRILVRPLPVSSWRTSACWRPAQLGTRIADRLISIRYTENTPTSPSLTCFLMKEGDSACSHYWEGGSLHLLLIMLLRTSSPGTGAACQAHLVVFGIGSSEHPAFNHFRSWAPRMLTLVADSLRYFLRFMDKCNSIFMAMQRLGIFSAWQFFPTLAFYIPFAASSPLAPVRLPECFTLGEIVSFIGRVALAAAPTLLYFLHESISNELRVQLFDHIMHYLPKPTGKPKEAAVHPARPSVPPPNAFAPVSLMLQQTDQSNDVESNVHTDNSSDDQSLPHPDQENHPPPNHPHSQHRRRESDLAMSNMEEYISDDEDNGEMVNTTLISFDVEATESADTPPGVWSAELRPNPAGDGRTPTKEEPKYRVSPLTLMPSRLVGHIFAQTSARILTLPLEMLWVRMMARSYRTRFGWPTADMHGPGLFSGVTMSMVANYCATEMVHLCLCSEIAVGLTGVALANTISEEEWLKQNGLDVESRE